MPNVDWKTVDIVVWLRGEAELVALDRLDEAADEIERLRTALHKIAYDAYTKEDENQRDSIPTMIWEAVAREALKAQ